jgi:23S rRNA pseudouridine1911/1915/1917 synthase
MARPGARPPCELAPEAIVFIDSQLVVVRKPAGISTVPHESDPAPSLLELLSARLRPHGRGPPRLHVVQRLDRETSGLLVLARTPAARELLKGQFRRRTVIRSYLALAAGELASSTFRSRLVRDRGDGRRGSTRNPKLGRLAVTHVELLERFAGASLVRCRLETGRTHQIRIQLSEAGHPLLGERAYRRRSDPDPPLPVGRLMLHAATLGFAHPLDARPMRFEEPMPPDMRSLCERLRAAAPPAGRDRGGLTALHRST